MLIEKIGQPTSKADLQKLLGVVNYMRAFVPNLAAVTRPLRDLLRKIVIFDWLPAHSDCLQKIKKFIEAPILRTFDANREISLETDASQF